LSYNGDTDDEGESDREEGYEYEYGGGEGEGEGVMDGHLLYTSFADGINTTLLTSPDDITRAVSTSLSNGNRAGRRERGRRREGERERESSYEWGSTEGEESWSPLTQEDVCDKQPWAWPVSQPNSPLAQRPRRFMDSSDEEAEEGRSSATHSLETVPEEEEWEAEDSDFSYEVVDSIELIANKVIRE
ncbi:hypothetical protein KIPB_009129, partial [Kipferlia bialata]